MGSGGWGEGGGSYRHAAAITCRYLEVHEQGWELVHGAPGCSSPVARPLKSPVPKFPAPTPGGPQTLKPRQAKSSLQKKKKKKKPPNGRRHLPDAAAVEGPVEGYGFASHSAAL